ncbi:MAG: hypothetical protein RL648_1222 [Verrucomicrobiota bacterium]
MNIPSLTTSVGRMNRLRVVKKLSFGVYLDGKDQDEILLPIRYVPDSCEVDDFLDVFIYLDSEDRLVATTETPLAMAGELAYLRVVAVNKVGAFLDWGLPKDLLVPFGEQREGLTKDRSYIVYVYFDKTSQRLVASTKLHKYINPKSIRYKPGNKVDLIVGSAFELGWQVIIDKRFVGVIYRNEVFQPVREGDALVGYIKQVRPDGKIDVELQKSGLYGRDALAEEILVQLKAAGGFLAVTDRSPPEEIQDRFKASKKAYKRAVGGLYKRRLITLEDGGIRFIGAGTHG